MDTHLYSGEVKLSFNEKTHAYRVTDLDGPAKKVPSVTGVLGIIDKSGPLLGWAVGQALKVVRGAIQPNEAYSETFIQQVLQTAERAHQTLKGEAGKTGSSAHEIIERCFEDESPFACLESEAVASESPALGNCLRAAGKWLSAHDVEPIYVERPVYSRTYEVSGRLDQVAKVDGEIVLLDWKSSSDIYPEHMLQTAAYVGFLEEELGDTGITGRYVIQLDKQTGEPHSYYLDPGSLRHDYLAFLAALTLYRRISDINKSKLKPQEDLNGTQALPCTRNLRGRRRSGNRRK